ncbi:MAG: hypothetical protein P4L28_06605 [Paludibacteraceae bacterium]|nr:hypothetical protein [Paludibacteraceae bacterium]
MNRKIIIDSVDKLLNCKDDFKQMRESTHQLYQIFSHITGININDQNLDKDIMLPEGKAISSVSAAHCLLEMKRTASFLRGIQKAITLKLEQRGKDPIRILYAGTGPYGTLVIPLLLLYKPEEICVDLIDINPQSLNALKKIINALELNKYIGNSYCLDAATFTCTRQYDIAISETMQSCLKKEPQVAIMQNLIPQLKSDAVFIPEEISIDAALCNPRMEMDRLFFRLGIQMPFQRISLGNIFKVNKQTLNTESMKKTIEIQENYTEFPELKLYTTIKVFDDEVLGENESSITMPIRFYNFKDKEAATQIKFWYTQGTNPMIESETVKIHEMVL